MQWKCTSHVARDIFRQKQKPTPTSQTNDFLSTYSSLALPSEKIQESDPKDIINPILAIWEDVAGAGKG